MTWRTRAACADEDPALFFPPPGSNAETINAARRICASCPVRDECLGWALEHRPFGIWGGLSENQRTRIGARPRPAAARDVIGPPHGTLAGVRAHYRRGEKLCRTCLQAQDLDRAERYAQTQSRVAS